MRRLTTADPVNGQLYPRTGMGPVDSDVFLCFCSSRSLETMSRLHQTSHRIARQSCIGLSVRFCIIVGNRAPPYQFLRDRHRWYRLERTIVSGKYHCPDAEAVEFASSECDSEPLSVTACDAEPSTGAHDSVWAGVAACGVVPE
jgi:hypothetical protein